MANTTPRKRFVQGVDLLNEKEERKALRYAKKATGKKRGFSELIRTLLSHAYLKDSFR